MRWLAFVAFATVAADFPEMFMGRLKGGFTSHLHEKADPSLLASHLTGDSTITQKLDHFDTANEKTWSQRYFFNHAYVTNDSNVNILYLSGEQTAALYSIVGTKISFVYYAKQLNADIYSLEHRFYGKSHPTEDTSIENLQYLSSRQALEDIAAFIRQINEEKGEEQKWIVVGGSYAGSLSAWSRLLHPELISGALSSSAPLLAQLDFYGFLQSVDAVFKKQGGHCYQILRDGIEEARRLLQTKDGLQTITHMFTIRPPLWAYPELTDYDKDTLFGHLINPFMGSAQYGSPPPANLCEILTDTGPDSDPLAALAFGGLNQYWNVNFNKAVRDMNKTEFEGDISQRLWTYQTCAEFGYFKSTNVGSNVFGQAQSSNSFIEYCVQLFGIDADQIEKNVERTNQFYGQRDYYAGTNVLFTHGTQDPWSFLTKKNESKHWSVVIAEIEDGTHCQDIGDSCFYPKKECTDNMKQVQALTLENMQRWIDPIFPVPDRVEITDNVGKRPQLYEPIVRHSSLQIDANSLTSTKLRAKRSLEAPKFSKKIDFTKWNKFTGKGRKLRIPPPVSDDDQPSETVRKDYIEQTWDHFNPNEERTFKQKWYSNCKFGSQDGPNFLMIGEEGPEDDYWVSTDKLAWMTYAKEVGANVFDLEHRYYGESKLGTNDLQYLTSAQMLYDVATFIRTQQVKNNFTGPWITFGGSYSGALAAWSREWFPELIVGAVGSSGPVLAKNDFYEYLEVVEDVTKKQSQRCYDRTAEAFETLQQIVQTPEGRANISDIFDLSPPWTSDVNETVSALDINLVFSTLSDMFMGTVQYNSVDWEDVKYLCSYFEDDTINSLDALSNLRNDFYDGQSLSSNYTAELESLAVMKDYIDGKDFFYPDGDLANLLWTWQTCNEFGYYQTTDYGKGIFGTPLPLNFYITMCEEVFDLTMDHVENGIARTNYQYGGRNRYNTTNVVLPNGDGDPWHKLGIVDQGNLDESVVPILIKGTSHCADMYFAYPDDPAELTQARKTILANIKKWMASPVPSTTPIATITTPKSVKADTTTVQPASSTSSIDKTSTAATTVVTTPSVSPTTSTTSASTLLHVTLLSLLFAFL